MTSAIQSIFPSNYSEEEIEPAIGIQSTVKPEKRLTLQEWYEYIGRLIKNDLNSPKPKNDE